MKTRLKKKIKQAQENKVKPSSLISSADTETLIDSTDTLVVSNSPVKYDQKVYVYSNNFKLFQSSVDILKPGSSAWLDDALYDVLSKLIIKEIKGLNLGDCLIMDAQTTKDVFHTKNVFKSDSNCSKYFSKHHQIDKFKYVIGMYSPAHHWFLCIANIEKKLFYFVDPSIATARVKKK